MPAPISIVIPTLNASAGLPKVADALLAGATEGLVCDVVVSDGGSTDETLNIAKELGATIVEGPLGRGGQIARGVKAARGSWVLILHGDTELSDDWVQAARLHIAAYADKAGYFRLAFDSDGLAPRLVAAGANLRSRWLGLPYGDQGLLISSALLEEIGGVPEVALMEDVMLAQRLKGRFRELDAVALTSAERFERDGWARRVAGNLWTLARFRLGASPDDLAANYARKR